ncbi:hypothetical protein I551_5744 [Mycobacterium ulcerans str. Harvey]|uniref:Uncharacterized protein n=1 Tax=Mycobacterium ulcerans str. Harvey TaxID=1299332 RepID=A0ABN0QSR1_MYCUL|nr:hypothetical protein I551_5744 [Mycobacterium ulcerans str. Harvey]
MTWAAPNRHSVFRQPMARRDCRLATQACPRRRADTGIDVPNGC